MSLEFSNDMVTKFILTITRTNYRLLPQCTIRSLTHSLAITYCAVPLLHLQPHTLTGYHLLYCPSTSSAASHTHWLSPTVLSLGFICSLTHSLAITYCTVPLHRPHPHTLTGYHLLYCPSASSTPFTHSLTITYSIVPPQSPENYNSFMRDVAGVKFR
jgi:hypothetical protein